MDELEWEIAQVDPRKTIQMGSFRINPDGSQSVVEVRRLLAGGGCGRVGLGEPRLPFLSFFRCLSPAQPHGVPRASVETSDPSLVLPGSWGKALARHSRSAFTLSGLTPLISHSCRRCPMPGQRHI